MLIIPAIDIMDKKCVRLRQGRFDDSTVFSDDPVAMAKKWVDQGAEFLHVVDLDGARTGAPQILDLLRHIARIGPPVEIGGGMRRTEHIEAALAAGAARVAVGSPLAGDRAFAKEIFAAFGDKIVAAIETRDGLVAIHGWQEVTQQSAVALAKELVTYVWPLFLFAGFNMLVSGYLTAIHLPFQSGLVALCRSLILPVSFLLLFYLLLPDYRFVIALPVAEGITFALALFVYLRHSPEKAT